MTFRDLWDFLGTPTLSPRVPLWGTYSGVLTSRLGPYGTFRNRLGTLGDLLGTGTSGPRDGTNGPFGSVGTSGTGLGTPGTADLWGR